MKMTYIYPIFNSMRQHYKFPLLVWLTSVLVGPKVALILFKFSATGEFSISTGYWKFYLPAVLIGGILSAPCFFVLWFCYNVLLKRNEPVWLIRLVLLLVSLLGCVSLFTLASLAGYMKFWSGDTFSLIGAHSLALIVGVLLFKVEEEPVY